MGSQTENKSSCRYPLIINFVTSNGDTIKMVILQ